MLSLLFGRRPQRGHGTQSMVSDGEATPGIAARQSQS